MKVVVLLFSLLCGAPLFLAAEAPLTLAQETYGVITPGDFLSWNSVSTASIAIPASGENQHWDYSQLESTGSFGSTFTTPQNGAFPTATIASRLAFIFSGYRIEGKRFEEISSQGHFSLGQSVEETTIIIDEGLIQGSLVVPAQNIPSKQTEIQFPATYGSTWSTPDTRVVANARLTVLFYNNTPAQLVQHHITHDTIIGWGRITVPGNSSHDVLLHKQIVVQIDSFYINGQPASDLLLTPLGMKQGDTLYQEYYSFHAAKVKGEVLQLGILTRQGQTSTFAYYNSNLPTSVKEQEYNAVAVQLYPTPIANNTTTVEFDKTSNDTWTMVLHNALGQIVQRIDIHEPMGHIRRTLALLPTLPNGTYFYTLHNEQAAPVSRGTIALTR